MAAAVIVGGIGADINRGRLLSIAIASDSRSSISGGAVVVFVVCDRVGSSSGCISGGIVSGVCSVGEGGGGRGGGRSATGFDIADN